MTRSTDLGPLSSVPPPTQVWRQVIDGTQLWSKPQPVLSAWGQWLNVDGEERLLVAGGDFPEGAGSAWGTAQLDASGNLGDVETLGSSSDETFFLTSFAVDTFGDVFVGADGVPGVINGLTEAAVLEIAPDSNYVMRSQEDLDLVVASGTDWIVAGTFGGVSSLIRLNSDGGQLWQLQPAFAPSVLGVDAPGRSLVAGSTAHGAVLARVSADGQLDWSTPLDHDPHSSPVSVAAASDGSIYVAGNSYVGGYLVRCGDDGSVTWTDQLAGRWDVTTASWVDVTDDGGAILAGSAFDGADDAGGAGYVAGYSADRSTPLWELRAADSYNAVAVRGSSIWLTGQAAPTDTLPANGLLVEKWTR